MTLCNNCKNKLPLFQKVTLDDNTNFFQVFYFCNMDCLDHWRNKSTNRHTIAKGIKYGG